MLGDSQIASSELLTRFLKRVSTSESHEGTTKSQKSETPSRDSERRVQLSLPNVGRLGLVSAAPKIDMDLSDVLASPECSLPEMEAARPPQHSGETAWDGEMGMDELGLLGQTTLGELLRSNGSTAWPGLAPGVELKWHQQIFLVFALLRLFQPKKALPWGGMVLLDEAGLGKTLSILALHAVLMHEILQEGSGGQDSRLTPMLSKFSLATLSHLKGSNPHDPQRNGRGFSPTRSYPTNHPASWHLTQLCVSGRPRHIGL